VNTAPSNGRRHTSAPSASSVPTPLPRLLTIEQIADHLGVSVRHVRRLVAERRIPFVKWGHLLRFDPAKGQRLARCPTGGADGAGVVAMVTTLRAASSFGHGPGGTLAPPAP